MKTNLVRSLVKTNQAKNNHAISGAPLKVSIKITDTNFIVLYELARPRAKITPNGKPANIAIIANIRFTKNPPHKVTLGPSYPNTNIKNINGIKLSKNQ